MSKSIEQSVVCLSRATPSFFNRSVGTCVVVTGFPLVLSSIWALVTEFVPYTETDEAGLVIEPNQNQCLLGRLLQAALPLDRHRALSGRTCGKLKNSSCYKVVSIE